jgi:release factor glutamine methyltransferase
VPDENPIVFYERIADVAWEALVSGGKLYFELHETTAHDVAAMARRRGFCEVEVVADINSKPRMLRCVKP